jgi:hypothetical protein
VRMSEVRGPHLEIGAKGTLFANGITFTTLDQKARLSSEPVRKVSALDGWIDVARGKVAMEISCKYQQSQ